MQHDRGIIIISTAVILSLSVGGPRAQQPPPGTPFRSGITYIQVDVSVLDRDRMTVRGLSPADFTVKEDSRPQTILSFSEIDLPAPDKPAAAWMRNVARDVDANDANTEGRLILIVLDDGQIRPQKSMEARVKAIGRRVVDEIGPADLAGVVFTKISSGAQDFTNDRAKLLAAIGTFAGHYGAANAPVTVADNTDRITTDGDHLADYFNRISMSALGNVVKGLALAPNRRKALIYVSVGMSIPLNPTNDATNAGGSTSTNFDDPGGLRAQMLDIFREAQRANVNIYSIDPSGLGGVVDEGVAALPDIGSGSNPGLDQKQEFLRTVAENTGGIAIANVRDFAPGVAQIFRENGSYYLLGYESPNAKPDGKFHKIDVAVNRPGVTVRTRRGFYDPRDTKTANGGGKSSPVNSAMTGLLPSADLKMQVTTAAFADNNRGDAAIAIAVSVRPNVPAGTRLVDDVQLQASALDPAGTVKASAQELFHIEGRGGRYERLLLMNLKPGRYQLRIAMQSKAAVKTGSVFTDIEVPDFSKAPLTLSGIILHAEPSLAVAPADRLAAVAPVVPTALRDFFSGQHVTAFLRVYQGGKTPILPVSLRAQILDSRNMKVYDADQTLDRDRFNANRAAESRVELPIDRLAPGPYLFTLQATDPTGTVKRDVRFQIVDAGK